MGMAGAISNSQTIREVSMRKIFIFLFALGLLLIAVYGGVQAGTKEVTREVDWCSHVCGGFPGNCNPQLECKCVEGGPYIDCYIYCHQPLPCE
jgi:hypothetical protein